MLSVTEARETILSAISPLPARGLQLSSALDCVLAENVVSPIDLPAWDNSAVDGYAVRSSDVSNAGENNPIHLRVASETPAGQAAASMLEPAACVRIFTGAPIPSGTDAVVMQEDTRPHHEGYIAVVASVETEENVRRAGSDVRAGTTILKSGTTLTPARIGLAAAVGAAKLMAHPKPRVGVLVTGAEIVEPGTPLRPSQIYDSNSFTLTGLVRQAGCEPVELGIADDTKEDLLEKIDYGLSECDAVVTVGGVSVGEYDLVKDALKELGCELGFWQVAMRPGKPFVFATRPDRYAFGLPGNPVSAAVTFLVLVRPALLRMRGRTDLDLPRVTAEVVDDFVNRGDRLHFMRGKLEMHGQKLFVRPLPRQGSHVITSLADADCLAEVVAGETIEAGRTISVMLLR